MGPKGQVDMEFRPFQKGFIGNGNHVRADNGRHAPPKEHPCKGYDKGLDIQISYQIPLHHAKGKAEGNQHCHVGVHPHPFHGERAHHADQRGNGTNGNINPPGNHHNRHAAPND